MFLRNIAQSIKGSDDKPEDLSLYPWDPLVERENQFPNTFLSPPHSCYGTGMFEINHTCTYKICKM